MALAYLTLGERRFYTSSGTWPADVQWGHINSDDLPLMDIPKHEHERYLVIKGDLLVNEGGSYPGRSAIWNGELQPCGYQKALHRLRPRCNDAFSPFLLLVMRILTTSGWLLADHGRSTISHIPAEDVRRLRVPCPPRAEQEIIVERSATEMLNLDRLVEKASVAIALLRERRSALIADAVTGQIDVRKHCKSSPRAAIRV